MRDTDQKKKIHLTQVFWWLGIKKSGNMNEAPLAKAGWRIIQGDHGLWSRIYRGKYLNSTSLLQPNYKNLRTALVHGPVLCVVLIF